MVDDFAVSDQILVATANHQTLGDADAEAFQVLVQCELIEGHGLDEHTTGGVGHVDEVEIALQDAILAGGAVDGDVGEVGMHRAAADLERKVFPTDGHALVVRKMGFPDETRNLDNEDFKFLLVNETLDALCTAQADIVL